MLSVQYLSGRKSLSGLKFDTIKVVSILKLVMTLVMIQEKSLELVSIRFTPLGHVSKALEAFFKKKFDHHKTLPKELKDKTSCVFKVMLLKSIKSAKGQKKSRTLEA